MNRDRFLTSLAFAALAALVACSGDDNTLAPAPHSSEAGTDATTDASDAASDALLEASAPADASLDAAASSADADAGAQDGNVPEVGSPDAAPITLQAGDGGLVTVDVVSPDRCVESGGHLLHCVFPTVTIDNTDTTGVAPLRTRLTRQESGNCSSQYDIRLTVAPTGGASAFFHLSDITDDVRRFDRGAMTELVLTDASEFPGVAVYDASCHITLDVQFDQPDTP